MPAEKREGNETKEESKRGKIIVRPNKVEKYRVHDWNHKDDGQRLFLPTRLFKLFGSFKVFGNKINRRMNQESRNIQRGLQAKD